MTVSQGQSRKLGRRLDQLQPHTEDFLDSQFFPSQNHSSADVANFFFFVTGIDHRTSPPNQSFEGTVDGKYFQGADLLWHLSLQKFTENPQLFHPSNMAQITTATVRDWYTVQFPTRVTIRRPQERAVLLRNCAKLLLENYSGSPLSLLEHANNRVTPDPETNRAGLLQLLSQFKAYQDPAHKKSYLLLKFLLRRNLWSVTDLDSVRIPVDNHLTRIALRVGIVSVSPKLTKQLRMHKPVTSDIDVFLRSTIADAYSLVGQYARRPVLELDDFFWHFGRRCCLAVDPICVTGCTMDCFVVEQLLNVSCQGTCPLTYVCLASTDDMQRALIEPKLKTWYY
ncbi:MAG: queuosine salvage family protein [Promethearchaeota archaeon]